MSNALSRWTLIVPKRSTTLAVPKTPRFVDATHRARGTQYAIFGIDAKDNALLALDTTTQKIVHSYDDGVTYSALCDFVFPSSVTLQHIHYLPDGEIVVGTSMTGATYGSRVYRSTGWRNPATATFTNTYNLPADTYFAYGSFSGHKNVVFIGEYGKQTKDAFDNGGNPAACAYLSRDGGKTFTKVLDIRTKTFVGEAGPWGTTTRMQHLHGVAYDPMWDRLWVVIGDGASSGGVTATVYSDDDGATWNVAFQSPWVHWQSVTPIALQHGVFMGSDFDGNGMRRFGRDGYRDIGEYSSAHLFDGGTSLQYIATSVYRAPSTDAPVLYSFMAVGSWNPGGVVATFDEGKTWVTLYKDTNNNGANLEYKGAYLSVGPTNTGRYVTLFNDTTRYPSGSVMVANLLTPDTTTFDPAYVPGDPLDLSEASPSAPGANKVRLFGRKIANKMIPAFRGPTDGVVSLQSHFGRNRVGIFAPAGGTTTSNIGYGNASTGTATAANMAMTNLHTYMRRIEYLVTTAATTAVASFRNNGQFFAAGTGSFGGYLSIIRWGPATGVTNTTKRAFSGVIGSSAAPTDIQPSTQVNIAGMGWDAADANIQFMHNDGSGTATKVDTGIPRASADRSSVYEIATYVAAGTTDVNWQITDLVSGAVASGVATTNVPAASTMLGQNTWTSVGGTSAVTGVAIMSCYFETDN